MQISLQRLARNLLRRDRHYLTVHTQFAMKVILRTRSKPMVAQIQRTVQRYEHTFVNVHVLLVRKS
ncbi:MAG: hypothetical protein EBT96_10760 [Betaproteobacteria bacterium]|nr:hypothetical protein [Betaproteobacteria bacterium]